MNQVALRTKFRYQSAARRRPAGDMEAAAFETELGWMAIAERDEVLTGVVFGHPSKRQAMQALQKNLGRDAASPRLDFLEIEEQQQAIIGPEAVHSGLCFGRKVSQAMHEEVEVILAVGAWLRAWEHLKTVGDAPSPASGQQAEWVGGIGGHIQPGDKVPVVGA